MAQQRAQLPSSLLRLTRPRQWVKNAFVLAPLLFSGKLPDTQSVRSALVATSAFIAVSAATYVLNDLVDVNADRAHPTKRTRPLASGQVGKHAAWALILALISSATVMASSTPGIAIWLAAYLALNVAYTFYLKHQPILDIFAIALGFVLRVQVGASAISVPLSHWTFVTVLSLALYLAAIKRRQELLRPEQLSRRVLREYPLQFVERVADMSGTAALVFYSLFVVSTQPRLVLSIPIVMFGLFRYWFLVDKLGDGESPEDALLSDPQLVMSVFVWATACMVLLTQT